MDAIEDFICILPFSISKNSLNLGEFFSDSFKIVLSVHRGDEDGSRRRHREDRRGGGLE